MKKLCIIHAFAFALALAAMLLTACSGAVNVPRIEDYEWTMTSVLGEGGEVIACSPGEPYEGAKTVEMTCKAENGSLTITDITGGESHTGSYSVESTSPESVIYNISIGDSQGYASSAMTTFYDGSQIPTFVMSIDGYALYFYYEE